jgi:hypothetical protein
LISTATVLTLALLLQAPFQNCMLKTPFTTVMRSITRQHLHETIRALRMKVQQLLAVEWG